MTDTIEYKKLQISQELEDVADDAKELAESLGLKPRDVDYWVIDHDEMNELIAYGGFQKRYPHWRWGMKYDRQQKQSQYMGGKAFEIVNNDDPCQAFLQMSNSITDQKSVITHVEAHSDFFCNNEWFQDSPNATDMLAKNDDRITQIMEDPDISREEVESFIDTILCLEDNIDQYSGGKLNRSDEEEEEEEEDIAVPDIDISSHIEDAVFGRNGEEERELEAIPEHDLEETEKDLIGFLLKHGKQFDEDAAEAVDFEDWQREILHLLRKEAYYFAPQKMTKCMNEGWAAFWESMMMTSESFVDDGGIIEYADHSSKVLNSPGFNPYSLGKALWEHIENTTNRREVVQKLLRIDGVNPDTFYDVVDFQELHEKLDKRKTGDIVERNYSLTRPENQGFIQDIPKDELKKQYRYMADIDRYSSVEEAVSDVDYEAGWKRMREVRETHNDVMFIDEFLTQRFVDEEQYFTYEFRASHQMPQIASRDVDDVRKKLLLKFTNFGKPTIEAASTNFNNKGELLLIHRYNGVILDAQEAMDVIERMFELWGRPINLATIGKYVPDEEMDFAMSEGVEPEVQEKGVRIRYDPISSGEDFEEHQLDEEIEEEIRAEEIDYSTKPEEWL